VDFGARNDHMTIEIAIEKLSSSGVRYCMVCNRSSLTYTSNDVKYLSDCTVPHWARGSVVVKALCYKPEGRGFDSR
jgi:hypothetical protein